MLAPVLNWSAVVAAGVGGDAGVWPVAGAVEDQGEPLPARRGCPGRFWDDDESTERRGGTPTRRSVVTRFTSVAPRGPSSTACRDPNSWHSNGASPPPFCSFSSCSTCCFCAQQACGTRAVARPDLLHGGIPMMGLGFSTPGSHGTPSQRHARLLQSPFPSVMVVLVVPWFLARRMPPTKWPTDCARCRELRTMPDFTTTAIQQVLTV